MTKKRKEIDYSDPDYSGLGARFALVYLEPVDLL